MVLAEVGDIFSGYPSPLERDLECRLTGQNCDEFSHNIPSLRRVKGNRRVPYSDSYPMYFNHMREQKRTRDTNPRSSPHSLTVAHSLFDAEEFDDATNVLNSMMEDFKGKEEYSKDGPVAQMISRIRLMIGIVQERISTKARHEFGPAFSSLARYNLAVKALRANSPEAALRHLDHVLNHAPTFAPALYNHGVASYQTGDLETALAMFLGCNYSSVLSDGKGSTLAAAAVRNIDLIHAREQGLMFARDNNIPKFQRRSLELAPNKDMHQHRMLETAVRHSLQQNSAKGRESIVVELGVWRGDTLRRIAEAARGHEVYGFDSFYGLPEDFAGGQFQRGAFSTNGIPPPRLPINVEVRPGWFNTSIKKFVDELKSVNAHVSFVHVDCDLYSSAKEALTLLMPVLSPLAVLQFDQFFGYPGWQAGEASAWWDVAKSFSVEFKYIWYEGMKVTVQLI